MDKFDRRVFRAYRRRFGKDADIPSEEIQWIDYKGKSYVQLSNVNGVLAIYRVNHDEKQSLTFVKGIGD